MTATYFYYITNGDRGIIAVHDNKLLELEQENGFDALSGIDLYDDQAPSLLKTAYRKAAKQGMLYDFEDIVRDYKENISDFNETEYELYELVRI